MKRFASMAIAAILTLSVAGTALADTSTETVTVTPSQTFSGVLATIPYPSANAGSNTTAPTFTIVAGTVNNPGGYRVNATFENLTDGGSNTILVSAHSIKLSATLQPNTSYASGILNNQWYSWQSASGTSAKLWESTMGQATPDTVNVDMRLAIPAGAVPAAYSGTATFTFALK